MIAGFALAAVAGVATIASPCILPVLPIVLATTAGRRRADPLLIITGFVTAFAASGILIGVLAASSGVLQQGIRSASILVLLLAGIVSLWSAPFDWLVVRVQMRLAAMGAGATPSAPRIGGSIGLLLVGASLGLAWAPCAGPILASVLALAASSRAPGEASLLLGAYAVGAGIPLLAIAYGGSWMTARFDVLKRHTVRIRQGFGAIAIAFALLQLLQYDVLFTAWATQWLPSISTGL